MQYRGPGCGIIKISLLVPICTCENAVEDKDKTRYYRDLLGLLFAVTEINENPYLLPNITLALKVYDSCLSEKRAVEGVLAILTGMEKPVPNFSCQPLPTMIGFVGGGTSLNSIAMASILDRYSVPEAVVNTPGSQQLNGCKYPLTITSLASRALSSLKE
ncbi:hypothetical protein NDU88_000130 [Pleurodeles waltl]|uniref:Receptor ligand binding region domain-containing protein n=1 Tax=Pleurodeles waltl TaxID=8319 RepID=A0AAV7V6P1_PLEWA|nr:hypothetical protein NDU88_000130 [Pleurodeles waltl]